MRKAAYLLWLFLAGGVGAQTSDSCYAGDCRPGARCRENLKADIWCPPGSGCIPVASIPRASSRAPIPLCLRIDTNYLPEVRQLRWPVDPSHPEGDSVLVFSIDSLQKDLCCATMQWACICDKQNSPCACTIQVAFLTDENTRQNAYLDNLRQWYFFPGSRAAAAAPGWRALCDSCDSTAYIIINATRWFITSSPRYDTNFRDIHRFFYNRGLEENYRRIRSDIAMGYVAYDICRILTHELGHYYGFGHHRYNDDRYSCDTQYTGVRHQAGPAYGFDITEDDRCIFAMRFCPELVGVYEESQSWEHRNGINAICIETGYPTRVMLYSLQGQRVQDFVVYPRTASGTHCESLSLKGLSSGVYIAVIVRQYHIRRQLVIVIK